MTPPILIRAWAFSPELLNHSIMIIKVPRMYLLKCSCLLITRLWIRITYVMSINCAAQECAVAEFELLH